MRVDASVRDAISAFASGARVGRLQWQEMSAASVGLVANLIANSEEIGLSAARDFSEVRRQSIDLIEATRDEAIAAGNLIRASPRFLRAAIVIGKCVGRYRLADARAERAAEHSSERALKILDAAHQRNARDFYELCVQLGGGLLKVGQLLSSRADLLPEAYIDQLSKLQDRAPARSFEEMQPVLQDAFGDPDGVFLSVDPIAIAAASFAQVHRAVTTDGKPVALKVQYPGIGDLVQADLELVALVARLFADSIPDHIDVETTVGELKRFLVEELDYNLEADRAEAFVKFAAGDDRWRVPKVFRQLSSERVLVLELIDGASLGQVLADGSTDAAEQGRLLALLVELTVDHILCKGVAHGDPHPGNLLVDKSGVLVLLDFGCVLELSTKQRRAYVDLVMAVLAREPERIAGALTQAGFFAQSPSALAELAKMFLEAFSIGALTSVDPSEQIRRATAILGAAGDVTVPPSFILVGRILALIGGLLFSHRPDVELAPLLMAGLSRARST